MNTLALLAAVSEPAPAGRSPAAGVALILLCLAVGLFLAGCAAVRHFRGGCGCGCCGGAEPPPPREDREPRDASVP